MASVEEIRKPLAQGWLKLLSDRAVKGQSFTSSCGPWKSYFFHMFSSDGATIKLFKKAPKSEKDKPSKTISYSHFQVHKRTNEHDSQPYICELIDNHRKSQYFGFDAEDRRDSFVFFLITQLHLSDTPSTGRRFRVKPENSPDNRRIGAGGCSCYLHVCKSGLTLAFQEFDNAIVAQWPLKSIRSYEQPAHNQFKIHSGKRSPMGEGVYCFLTPPGGAILIYAQVDKHVEEIMAEKLKPVDDLIYEQYCSLRDVSSHSRDTRFSLHLEKISHDNFSAQATNIKEFAAEVASGHAFSMEVSHKHHDGQNYISDIGLPEDKISDVEQWLDQDSNISVNGTSSPRKQKAELSLLNRGRRNDINYLDMSSGSQMSLNKLVSPSRSSAVQPSRNLKIRSYSQQSPVTRQRIDSSVSQSSSIFSPVTVSSPPPPFYDAIDLPSYHAPTPPNASEAESPPFKPAPINIIQLPPRTRVQAPQPSTSSCEDLTDLVRDSIAVTPEEWRNYENAMFTHDSLNVGDRQAGPDLASRRSKFASPSAGLTTESGNLDLNPVSYEIAEDVDEESLKDHGRVGVTSTYLYGREELALSRYPEEIDPYHTTILSPATNIYIARLMAGSLDLSSKPNRARSWKGPQRPSQPLPTEEFPPALQSADVNCDHIANTSCDHVARVSSHDELTAQRGSLESASGTYEDIDEKQMLSLPSGLSQAIDCNVVGRNGGVCAVGGDEDATSLLGDPFYESTCTVSEQTQIIRQQLPLSAFEACGTVGQAEPADVLEVAVAAYSQAMQQADNHNDQYGEYLVPQHNNINQEIRLPMPSTTENEYSTKPPKFGFGTIRRMLSEISRERLRPSKSISNLSHGEGQTMMSPTSSEQAEKLTSPNRSRSIFFVSVDSGDGVPVQSPEKT